MPKLKPEELETRKREIIEAARRCFLRSGFHQTTTDDLCHEAAITPGGLYHYFPSKDEIIAAVIEDTAHSVVERLGTITEASDDLRSAFQGVAQFFTGIMRDPDLDNRTRLDVEIWAETLRNEKLAAITHESWALRRQWLESLMRRAISEGLYGEHVDPRALADLLLAVFIGLRLANLLWQDFDLDAAVRSLFLMHAGRLGQETPVIGLQAK